MDDCASSFLGGAFVGLMVGLAFGGWWIGSEVSYDYKTKAIEHNCAHYDQKTGEWQWKK